MVEFKLMETLQYRSENSEVEGEFLIGNETLWASQKIVAEIFGTTPQNISKHFRKIIEDEELNENEVSISSKKLFQEDSEFINSELIKSKTRGRPQIWYNLDAIIQAINGMSTRDKGEFIGRGTGLNSTINIVTQANGNVLIASGDCVIELTKHKVYAQKIPEEYIKGTLVSLRVPNKPLNVFKGLNYVEYELPKKELNL